MDEFLYRAILDDDFLRVKEILIGDPPCVDSVDNEGIPMSFIAAKMGNISIVQYIVEYSRASMNTVDKQHRTILHYGVESGNLELVRYLVEKVGMSVCEADFNLLTPFELANQLGFKAIEAYFESVCGSPLSDMYKNPIRTGMFPDPSIIRVGEDYYMVNSSFIYFPCIPISHSKDLINWEIIGHGITNPEWANLDDLEGGRGYWAPDISVYNDTFYITATYRLNDTGTIYRKQIVMSAKEPQGPYSEPIIIDEDGIDPSIFNDDDGKRYMLLNRGARIFQLDESGTKKISEPRLLYYGANKRAPEGPHLLKKDGFYYLFLAEGGTGPGHQISVARSNSLFGQYQPCPYNPIMIQKNKDAAIQRCGHGKPVMTQDGQWYMVYLCGRMIGDGYSLLGRETAIDPITWTEDGWPLVNDLKGPSGLQRKPILKVHCSDQSSAFSSGELGKEWMFPRSPDKDGYRFQDGCLWLKASTEQLSTPEARNILLRRQQHFKFIAKSCVALVSMETYQEIGMIGYYDENTWFTFGLAMDGMGRLKLRVVEHIGDENRIHEIAILDNSILGTGMKLYLRIKTDYFKRTFNYSLDGESYKDGLTLDNIYYLSDEGINKGKRFTGGMIGIYGYSHKKTLYVPFYSFDYDSSIDD